MAKKNRKNSVFIFNKTFILALFVVIIFLAIVWLFFKVQHLEFAKKELSSLPLGIVQTVNGKLTLVESADHIQGNAHAPITIIEYSDFECPECQTMHPILQSLVQVYDNNIRLVSRLFPLPQNKNAQKEAEAAICAGQIGGNNMFWKYSDEIYKKTNGGVGGEGFPLEKLIPLAKELGLNENSFSSCLHSSQATEIVNGQKQSGENAGVNQLPAMFIVDSHGNITVVTGNQTLETMKIIVDAELARIY